MLLKTSYVLRFTEIVQKVNGHLPIIFYIKNIEDLMRIEFVDKIETADTFENLSDAYYAQKKAIRLLDKEVEIVKMKVSCDVETVKLEEIRAAILKSAKSKLTQEEYESIQYHTLPNQYHKKYDDA